MGTMCRHCVRNPQPGSSKTLRKGCFEEDEEGKASRFNLGEQTKVRKGNARMTMGGSKKREKEGLWLSWKEAIQQFLQLLICLSVSEQYHRSKNAKIFLK